MYGIILAGGSGSRLWPLSRELYPKQLIKLDGDESPLQSTFKRLANLIDANNIISVTNIKHSCDVKLQLSQIHPSCLILSEPTGKNTAPAIACSLQFIKQISTNDEIVIIVPSDHVIKDIEAFNQAVLSAQTIAKEGYIVTLGIKPTYAETGYGYIKSGEKFKDGFKVEQFVEKPNIQTAQKYLDSGDFYWNAGIFIAKISTLLEEFETYSPDIYQHLNKLDLSYNKNISEDIYSNMPSISLDYAIIEKSKKLTLVELKSCWNDLGSWESLYNVREKNKDGNVVYGNIITNDVKDSFLYSTKKLVAVSGLEDIVIVETEDAIMACKKSSSQDVKKIYDELKLRKDSSHQIHKTVFRPWGYYTNLTEGEGYITKLINVSPQQKLSIQSHNYRSEQWTILEGNALVILDDKEFNLTAGQTIDIPTKSKHSLQNPYDKDLKIIEIQRGEHISEDDIIRYSDIYGRI